jgi:hypothetical protein
VIKVVMGLLGTQLFRRILHWEGCSVVYKLTQGDKTTIQKNIQLTIMNASLLCSFDLLYFSREYWIRDERIFRSKVGNLKKAP